MGEPFIGIDFGTSKCVMTWYDPEKREAKIIRNAEGKEETPSIVYLGRNDNEIVVGELAERKLTEEQIDPRYFVVSVKRNLLAAPTRVLDDERVFSPVRVAEQIFRKLKVDAERGKFYQPVTRTVITCPAAFDNHQRKKIREAAEAAGFIDVRLLDEPVAAAIAYEHTSSKVDDYILVYDFGGGTFDVALLVRHSDGTFDPALNPRGLAACGGDDLDHALYRYCEEIAQQQLHRSISLAGDIDLKFLRDCRQRKEILSSSPQVTFSSYLRSNNGPAYFKHTVSRAEFEGRIKQYINNTVRLTREIMDEASARHYNIDTVVLIGGSSRVPMVPQSLRADLQIETREFEHRDFAVALGAAYYAQQIWGGPEEARIPPLPPPSFAPTTSQEKYRQAVARAFGQSRGLTQAQVDDLNRLAGELHLSAEEADAIERQVMGHSKEGILYFAAVAETWASLPMTQEKVNELATLAAKLGLMQDRAAAIERQIMAGHTKETVLYHQRQGLLTAYHSVVAQVWEGQALSIGRVNELGALASKWGLNKDEAATVERNVTKGYTKEDLLYYQHQRALAEYRNAIAKAWQSRSFTLLQLYQLTALAIKLGLSIQETEEIERQIMQTTKDVFLHRGNIPPMNLMGPPGRR
jgi:actin-like ATPase involved in cell morphogenesis